MGGFGRVYYTPQELKLKRSALLEWHINRECTGTGDHKRERCGNEEKVERRGSEMGSEPFAHAKGRYAKECSQNRGGLRPEADREEDTEQEFSDGNDAQQSRSSTGSGRLEVPRTVHKEDGAQSYAQNCVRDKREEHNREDA